jgi:hypothetical protein
MYLADAGLKPWLKSGRFHGLAAGVHVIHIDGVLRYFGKGTNGCMYTRVREVRQRLTRKFKLKNIRN